MVACTVMYSYFGNRPTRAHSLSTEKTVHNCAQGCDYVQ